MILNDIKSFQTMDKNETINKTRHCQQQQRDIFEFQVEKLQRIINWQNFNKRPYKKCS